MNRRQLLNSATCLIPGAAFLSGSTKAAVSFPSGDSDVSCFRQDEAILASRNTEEVVMELLHICLERIEWQGNVSDWRAELDQALGRIQSRLKSKNQSLRIRVTAFQMDCLFVLCRAASSGINEDILESAFRFCDAFLPFDHWMLAGFQLGKDDKLDKHALQSPKFSCVTTNPYCKIQTK
jgi:hypothetical protein